MKDIYICQRKDKMYNASIFIREWNKHSIIHKDIDDFFENANTKTIIGHIMSCLSVMFEDAVYVKSRARADRGGGTWMHPLLFKYFLIWLDPFFAVQLLSGKEIGNLSYIAPRKKGKKISKTYIMYDKNINMFKIGKSRNPLKRERTLQAEKPTISLLYVCDEDIEGSLHILFQEHRVRGEWFKISKETIKRIVKDFNFKEVFNYEDI